MHSTTLPPSDLPVGPDQTPARDPFSAALKGFFNLLDELGQPAETTAVREDAEVEKTVFDQGEVDTSPVAAAEQERPDVSLKGRRIAILATDGFEPSELEEPRKALKKAGAQIEVVSLKSGRIRGWADNRFSRGITVDVTLDEAQADDYDGLLLPGGVMNPDKLRMEPKAVAFARAFFDAHKPVAAICHAPQLLIQADVVRGRRLTSYPSVRVDLINAGADWVDEAVVVDLGLVTSRSPEDLPAFNEKMIEEFAEGPHPAP
jgi:protease I